MCCQECTYSIPWATDRPIGVVPPLLRFSRKCAVGVKARLLHSHRGFAVLTILGYGLGFVLVIFAGVEFGSVEWGGVAV